MEGMVAMIKIQLMKLYHELDYFSSSVIATLKLKYSNSQEYSLIQKNQKFKNIHKGKRCFILGNGPSVKNEKLKLLKDEYVFTVNQAARMPDFDALGTSYHFWADPLFFKKVDDAGSEELIEIMKRVRSESNNPEVFLPIEQLNFVKDHKLDDFLKISYFKTQIQFYDGFNHAIDFTKVGPAFCTVVQWCVSMAIYMGFSEIYLLGCDNTSLLVTLKSALKQNDDNDYAYHVTENEKNRMEKLLNYSSVETYTQSYLNNIRQYRYLMQYCLNRNIKLVNCSSTTVLDCVPRMSLEEVINGKRS